MASHYAQVFGKRHPIYVAYIHRDLARLRAAMTAALGLRGSQAGDIDLNRAINQLLDVDAPVRLAWDYFLLQLEAEHQMRLQAVRTDIARYGSLLLYLGDGWRWLSSPLTATRHLLELATRLSTTMQRLCRLVSTHAAARNCGG